MTAQRGQTAVMPRLRQGALRGLRSVRRLRGHRPPGPGRPPPVPEGWVVGPPDFVGIGAQKAGTSWWDALIHRHPMVDRASGREKELHFFDEYWERPFGDADVARYASHFARGANTGDAAAKAGEWTPSYMVDFWAPQLIRRAAPQARVLVLLRDPVERYRSSMEHTQAMSRGALGRLDAMGAFQRGLYAQQLRRVFAAFPRDQVLVLQYERCRADPAGQLARTYEFIGLPPFQPDPGVFQQAVNPTTGTVELTPDLRADLATAYAPDLVELAGLLPDLDLDLWPTVHRRHSG